MLNQMNTTESNWIRTSVSARDCFDTCPRKWYLRYRTDVPAIRKNRNATCIGLCVHRVLEVYFSTPTAERPALYYNFASLVADSIEHVLTKDEAEGNEAWEYSNQEEAIIFACATVLVKAMEKSGLEVVRTEHKLHVGECFTGIIDVVARTPSGDYVIVDYKNQADFLTLADEVYDVQLRMYEAVADHLLAELPPGRLLGTAKLVAKKPKNKFRCKGSANESFEEYTERSGTTAQFVFIQANPEVSKEYMEEHKRINKLLNETPNTPEAWPKARKSCIGKYGPCEYYSHCNPHVNNINQPGFALAGEELKHIATCLTQMTEQPIAPKAETSVEASVEDFW